MSPQQAALAIDTVQQSAGLDPAVWSAEKIETVKRMAAPAARNVHELAAFLHLCQRYDLDPLAKELYMIQGKGGPQICAGRETFLKVARRDPNYQGCRSGVVYEKDHFSVDVEGSEVTVHHRIDGLDRGQISGAYAVARKEGQEPVLVVRRWDDYKHLHAKDNWRHYGDDMIETRCIVAALRRQFGLSGIYHETEFADPEAQVEAIEETTRAKLDAMIDQERDTADEELAQQLQDSQCG